MATSSAQLRKIKKPLIERRRRERINECLGQLKMLVLEATNKEQESRYSKMEKADILEMTVSHLRSLHRRCLRARGPSDDQDSVGKYVAGFQECAVEVGHYLSNAQDLSTDVRMSLMKHLTNCLSNVPHIVEQNDLKMSSKSVEVSERNNLNLRMTANYQQFMSAPVSPFSESQSSSSSFQESPSSSTSIVVQPLEQNSRTMALPVFTIISGEATPSSGNPQQQVSAVIPLYSCPPTVHHNHYQSTTFQSVDLSNHTSIPCFGSRGSPRQGDEFPHSYVSHGTNNPEQNSTLLSSEYNDVDSSRISSSSEVLRTVSIKSDVWRPW